MAAAAHTARGPWPALVRTFPALGSPAFLVYWAGSFFSSTSFFLSQVATGYAALTLSGSATTLGVVTALNGLPMIVFSPIAGVVADRFPRRTVTYFTQGSLGLSAGVIGVLTLAGLLETWHLAALSLAQGICFSFNIPARQSLLAEVVGPRLVRSASALNQSISNLSRVLGPSIAGILLALPGFGVGGVYVTMTCLYAIVVFTLTLLPPSPPREPDGSGLGAVWHSIVEGLRYVFGSSLHRGLIAAAMAVLVLGSPVLQIMPVFSERVFDVGATGLGLLLSANGVGALLGSIGAAALAGTRRPGLIQIGLGIGVGVTVIGFALAPSLPIAFVMIGLFGVCQAAYMALNGTILIANTEPRLYGRVMSVYMMTFAATPFAALPLAWASDLMDPAVATATTGVLVIGAVLAMAAISPTSRNAR